MAKDTFYFSHDYNARNDDKIKNLIRKHGMRGYGVFWAIVEDLYNNANALRLDCEGIAYDMREDCQLVTSVIHDFGFFVIEGDTFGSISIGNRLDERNAKSKKARENAHKRWAKSSSDANALPPHSDRNAIKEVKEIKETKEEEKSKEGKEIIEVEAVASPPVVKKEKFSIEKFTDPGNLPFTGDEFISKWGKLLQTKKWRNKSESAIEETVAKMQRFNEEFMTRQIESALVGEWQGLFFSNTESDFQKFLQGNGKTSFEKKVQGMNSTAAMALQLLNQKEFDNEHGN